MLRRVGLLVALLLAVGCSSSPAAPLAFAHPPTELSPGESFDVSGSGCPAQGSIPLAQPEQVFVLAQPVEEASNQQPSYYADESGRLAFVGPALATDVSAQRFVVTSDGTWTGSITTTAAAPGSEWSLTAICLTRVRRDSGMESRQQITDESPTVVVTPIPVR